MMIINEFSPQCCQSPPAGGVGSGGGAPREGGEPAGAGAGPGQPAPQSPGGLSVGPVPHLSPRHHVLELRLAAS